MMDASDRQNIEEILTFWKEAGEEKWWKKNNDFDAEIIRRFKHVYDRAAAGELDHWAQNPDGCLALIIVLDQFPRNMFRNDPRAFAQDPKALRIAQIAVDEDHGPKVDPDLAAFLFMPFMHSEALADQDRSIELQKCFGGKGNVDAAIWHREIIEKFGRFPHRNPVLGREMTRDEQAYLDDGGFKG